MLSPRLSMNTHFPIFLPVLISYNDGTNTQFQVEEYKVVMGEVKAIYALLRVLENEISILFQHGCGIFL